MLRVIVSPEDVLTDGTARQIVAHDETGAKLCGWEPTSHDSKSGQDE